LKLAHRTKRSISLIVTQQQKFSERPGLVLSFSQGKLHVANAPNFGTSKLLEHRGIHVRKLKQRLRSIPSRTCSARTGGQSSDAKQRPLPLHAPNGERLGEALVVLEDREHGTQPCMAWVNDASGKQESHSKARRTERGAGAKRNLKHLFKHGRCKAHDGQKVWHNLLGDGHLALHHLSSKEDARLLDGRVQLQELGVLRRRQHQ